MKTCSVCKGEKSLSEFHKNKNTKDGHHSLCRVCRSALTRRVREEKKAGTYISRCRKTRLSSGEKQSRAEYAKVYHKKYREENRAALTKNKRQYRHQIRAEGIKAYGGKCSCCGESRVEFLTLEHLNGRGSEDITRGHTGGRAWMLLRKHGWPTEGFTVLCFNCNCAKGIYGTCPHQQMLPVPQ